MARKIYPAPLARLYKSRLRQVMTPRDRRLITLGAEPGTTVLDVGTGDGFLLQTLSKRLGASGQIHAIDNDPAAIARAQQLSLEGAPAAVEVCDATHTSLADRSVDLAILHHVFHLLDDRLGTIQELRRVLKVNGKVALWEAHLMVEEWRLDGYEGMFIGNGFVLESRLSDFLGHGRRFRFVDGALGCKLRTD